MGWPQRLRRPVPAWLVLLATLVTASAAGAVFWGPNLLYPRPDFQMQPTPASQTILAGCNRGGGNPGGCQNGGSFEIAVKSLNGFTGIVTLTTTTPASVNATLVGFNTPNPVAILGRNDTVFGGLVAGVAGNYTITVTGTSGQLSHTVSISIVAQDMTFNDSPDPLVVPQGSGANMTITIRGVNGLRGNLAIVNGPTLPGVLYGSQVLLFSAAANCVACRGNPPPFPLLPGGTVEVIVMATWQASYSSETGGWEIHVSVPGLDGFLVNDFTISFS